MKIKYNFVNFRIFSKIHCVKMLYSVHCFESFLLSFSYLTLLEYGLICLFFQLLQTPSEPAWDPKEWIRWLVNSDRSRFHPLSVYRELDRAGVMSPTENASPAALVK